MAPRPASPTPAPYSEILKMSNTDSKQLSLALTTPFPANAVHFRPLLVKDGRALAVAYLDARAVMQRLDSVFGVGGWQDSYQIVIGGNVVCTLAVKVDSEWIRKSDVGNPSEQSDEGDKLKAAFSDSLKRAACKIGVGRYLYRVPAQWVEYDAQKKQFKAKPKLSAWALPAPKPPNEKSASTNGASPARNGHAITTNLSPAPENQP